MDYKDNLLLRGKKFREIMYIIIIKGPHSVRNNTMKPDHVKNFREINC